MGTTLPLYWNLSSVSKNERLDASVKLISALEHFQSLHVHTSTSHDERVSASEDEDALDDEEPILSEAENLDRLNAQDIAYAIRRLVRGLASPRESSRLGFSVALTELLSRLDTVTCSQIVTLISDSSKPQGSTTGQEERDLLFAQLFGLTAVIQSGLIVRAKPLPSSASATTTVSSLSSYTDVLQRLVALGEKKSWLRESVWWTIGLAIDSLNASQVGWKDDAVHATLDILFVQNKDWSPEKLALVLKLQRVAPTVDWNKILAPTFKSSDLLANANLQNVARIMKESSWDEDDEDGPKAPTGSWKPQLHFVWDAFLEQLLPADGASSKGSFQEFFRVVVDQSLFALTSSPQRKFWGFQVFLKALPRVTSDTMSMLFTKNFMRSWINHLSQKDRYLHKIAHQVALHVQTFVKNNPQLGFSLILQLTGVNGSAQFDKLTKTKTVENILTSMNEDGIKNYIDHLLDGVNNIPPRHDINSKRFWLIEQLSLSIRNRAIPKSDNWVKQILDWLVVHGIFSIRKKTDRSPVQALRTIPSPPFSNSLQKCCRQKLLACLADLATYTTAATSSDGKISKVSGASSHGSLWISVVLKTISVLENDQKHVEFLDDFDEERRTLHTKLNEVIAKIQKIDSPVELLQGAEVLSTALLVESYCKVEDEDLDVSVLESCLDGTTRLYSEVKASKKSKAKSKSSTDEATSPVPVDVLVDVIVGFLEQSSAYLRAYGNKAFSLLCDSVRDSTIDLILIQLERRDPMGQGDEDAEDATPVEDGDEDADDDIGSESESDEEDEENEEASETLRLKIEEALKVSGIKPATEDDEDEDEDEEFMDDDQMMAIDAQLAQVFKSQTGEKSKGVDVQREATHFKNRVLDLLDIFLKKQPSSALVLRLVQPLVELIVGSGPDERQLSDKARGIFNSRIAKSKELISDVDVAAASSLLQDLHTRARHIHSADNLSTLSQASLYLSRNLVHVGSEKLVVAAYRESLSDFATRKNSTLNVAFFQNFLSRNPLCAWSLRMDVLEICEKAVNVYRRCQILQFAQILINHLALLNMPQLEVKGFMIALQSTLETVLKSACDGTTSLTAAQAKELLKMGLSAARSAQRLHIAGAFDPHVWTTLASEIASCSRLEATAALPKLCIQIANVSGASDSRVADTPTKAAIPDDSSKVTADKKTKSGKRKAEAAEGVMDTNVKKKRSRKNSS
ncbi:hypothetical protein FISHEDRAFT_38185 [Fistulina hepatica ATCC 64428]|nr:hypothetical protein FISHEDRAFT_38185 [Fistulina hepatica ATCC 64428]